MHDKLTYMLVLNVYEFSCIFSNGNMWTLIYLLLTLDKKYILTHGSLDYLLLTWASKVFRSNINYYLFKKNTHIVISV